MVLRRGGGIGLWVAMMVLLAVFPVRAAETADGPADWELATVVVGKDGATEVERKLGTSSCLLPSSTGETMSYLYNVGSAQGPFFLRLEVNGHVDAMTISKDPPIAGVCYAPTRQTVPVHTGKGLRLGATIEDVVHLYGKPTESFSVGPMTRYRYVVMYDQSYEWDLVFRGGKLVEWTVATEG